MGYYLTDETVEPTRETASIRGRAYEPKTAYTGFCCMGNINQYVFCNNDPVNFVDPFGLLPKEQWDALNRILALERELGTHETARLISNTWGKDNVLQPFNADTGHNSHVNGVDIDWFTDLSSVNDANFPVITTAAYIAGKSGWSIMRRLSGDPNGNPFPFQDPGERAAVLKAELGRKYSDIITPAYMEKERPKNCK